jgi:hypothetical protein
MCGIIVAYKNEFDALNGNEKTEAEEEVERTGQSFYFHHKLYPPLGYLFFSFLSCLFFP